MASLMQRLAQPERRETQNQGDSVLGIRTIDYFTRSGPDAVRVQATGEMLTEAEFRRRYPQGYCSTAWSSARPRTTRRRGLG